MEIPDKNVFTATEVITLIPMQGEEFSIAFMKCNEWYKNYFPNAYLNEAEIPNASLIKRCSKIILEPMFFNQLAEKLDKYFMKKTYKRWMSLYNQGYTEKEFELAFRTHRGTSKNHDKNYQKRVLSTVEQNVQRAFSRIKTKTANG